MNYDFSTVLHRFNTGSTKWEEMKKYGITDDSVVPLSNAEMEFRNAPEITEGLCDYIRSTVLSYFDPMPDYFEAVRAWHLRRHGFDIPAGSILPNCSLHAALCTAVRAFSQPGDGVIVMQPTWPGFLGAVRNTGRTLVTCLLQERDGKYGIDFDLLREQAAQNGLQDFVGQSAFVVLVTRLSDAAGTVCTPPSMAGSVDMVAEKYLRHASFYSGGRVLTLLGGNPSDFEEYLHILADELVQTSERIMRCRCAVGVSAAAEGFAGLHAACREASEALSYAGLRQSSIRYYSDMRRSAPARTEAMTDLVARTESAFKSGSPAALDACLAAMFTPENIERCGKSGLELTALQLIAGISRILFTAAGGEAAYLTQLADYGVDKAFARELSGDYYLYSHLYELSRTAGSALYPTQAELDRYASDQGLITVEEQRFSSEAAAGKALAALTASAQPLTDFASLGGNDRKITFVSGDGTLSDVLESAALALKQDAWSQVLSDGDGFCLLLRRAPDAAAGYFDAQLQSAADQAKISCSSAYDSIDVASFYQKLTAARTKGEKTVSGQAEIASGGSAAASSDSAPGTPAASGSARS